VNGKVRARIEAPALATQEELLALAKGNENVAKYLDGAQIVKEIVVPGKLVNLVVK
jgi:leucyl-tRNA synthetase